MPGIPVTVTAVTRPPGDSEAAAAPAMRLVDDSKKSDADGDGETWFTIHGGE